MRSLGNLAASALALCGSGCAMRIPQSASRDRRSLKGVGDVLLDSDMSNALGYAFDQFAGLAISGAGVVGLLLLSRVVNGPIRIVALLLAAAFSCVVVYFLIQMWTAFSIMIAPYLALGLIVGLFS